MSFNIGDRVLHKSDKKPRKMVVADRAFKESPPSNRHNELANIGHVADGSYYCTWIAGSKKGEGYFNEAELELQKT
jgi:uncharacterized protein YodC (DUF2158 family)